CGSDQLLRREVQTLLSHTQQADAPVARAADAETTTSVSNDDLTGQVIGAYRVVRRIGAGGMGMVYEARDTRLNRSVAIKVSRTAFTGRFATEARAVAALNHPHVCTLYDVGPNYLVMEFIEGENLADRIQKGPLSVDLALRCGMEIAEAISAAHDRGIIH